MSKSVGPSPAATVLLMRSSDPGFEVLMVHRHHHGFFGGLVVFPGGGVDPADRGGLARAVIDTEAADHAHRAAALRELAEETGILLGSRPADEAPPGPGASFYETLHRRGTSLDGDRLTLVSRWVTPETAPRRYDTRFYAAEVSGTTPVRVDRSELSGHDWVTPAEALQRHRVGEWAMILPTLAHLRWLSRRASIDEALESATGADGRTLVEPKRMGDGSIVPLLLPAERT